VSKFSRHPVRNNRFYSPDIGRFISADPLGMVDGPNVCKSAGFFYGICRNEEELFTDSGVYLNQSPACMSIRMKKVNVG